MINIFKYKVLFLNDFIPFECRDIYMNVINVYTYIIIYTADCLNMMYWVDLLRY